MTQTPAEDPILAAYRKSIDNIDSALVHMLAERFRITKAVGVMYFPRLSMVLIFLIMALVIFCLVRGMNRLRERLPRKEAEEEAPPAPSKEEVLLTEIRDLLKEQK